MSLKRYDSSYAFLEKIKTKKYKVKHRLKYYMQTFYQSAFKFNHTVVYNYQMKCICLAAFIFWISLQFFGFQNFQPKFLNYFSYLCIYCFFLFSHILTNENLPENPSISGNFMWLDKFLHVSIINYSFDNWPAHSRALHLLVRLNFNSLFKYE